MSEANKRERDLAAEVRVIVEVDGKPVGFLDLDVDRLWPLINHRSKETLPSEWLDPERYDALLRAAVVKQLTHRLSQKLYQGLGEEIVKAQLDLEAFALKVEAAAQTFGNTRSDIEQFVAESDRTPAEFHSFFWDYLLSDREISDLKKEWKASR
jgi:hypothetical protein